ncbi:MAG: hypothetical protein IAF38_17130 [Bacteroidia bacterium]|nr:hypothetical protein [Bacteroidia bacterium]
MAVRMTRPPCREARDSELDQSKTVGIADHLNFQKLNSLCNAKQIRIGMQMKECGNDPAEPMWNEAWEPIIRKKLNEVGFTQTVFFGDSAFFNDSLPKMIIDCELLENDLTETMVSLRYDCFCEDRSIIPLPAHSERKTLVFKNEKWQRSHD